MRYKLILLLAAMSVMNSAKASTSIADAIKGGEASLDMRLRYEAVEQDNVAKDADALTLRTRLGYTTAEYQGFSAKLEMEDVRIAGGFDEYTVGPAGFNPGQYSVIADPEVTEVEQGFVQYKSKPLLVKLGRQVITYDGHRFVGHVGWRQDRQTFDALSVKAQPIDKLTLNYSYLFKRNRIFAEAADAKSKDHLLNAAYQSPVGKLVAYAYLLETDNGTSNGLDTYGISLKGATKVSGNKLSYRAEYATQESSNGATEFDADYLLLEGGLAVSGITFQLGYELLGSDSGSYGFSTPLATLHKFNGWSDQFLGTPSQGLEDIYVAVGGKALGGKWKLVYHDFSVDDSSATIDDLGSELDVLFAKKFGGTYSAGIKYAAYSAGDATAGKVDTDKLWLWVGAKF